MAENNQNKFYDLEIEKSLLGYLLINNNAFEDITDVISQEHFFLSIHKEIYSTIQKLLMKSQIADIHTVYNYISYNSKYKEEITREYLLELTDSLISSSNYMNYATIIHESYIKREISSLQNNISKYLNTNAEAQDTLDKIEQDIFSITEHNTVERNLFSFSNVLGKVLGNVETARETGGLNGYLSGLRDIDERLGGLQKSDLIVLAGRPSMGKTALATNIAYNCASAYLHGNNGGPVLIFSLEMSADQIAARILAQIADIPGDLMRKPQKIDNGQFNRIVASINNVQETPIFIDDTAGTKISHIRSQARRIKRQHGLALIIVDYIQLISGEGRSTDSRVNEVSAITRGLKNIAKELDVPLIALSQLSRAVESRDDKRPMLADLRESGSIEQDADVVAFIFREEYYLLRSEPEKVDISNSSGASEDQQAAAKKYAQWQDKFENARGKATVILAKNRHGDVGNVDLFFDSEKTLFGNLDKSH